MRLAIVPFALLLAAAAPRQGCGNGGNRAAWDPCAGKACGEACHACAPDDRDCVETMELKVCDPLHRCVSATVPGPLCSPAQDACAGKACGDACTIDPPCRSATPPCMTPSLAGFCDAGGSCVAGTTPPECSPPPQPPPPSWGCVGKQCGDSCGVCPDGTDPSRCPVPTFAATACDAQLQCVTAGTFTCPPPAFSCAGKRCGDACCEACMSPVANACDAWGRCVFGAPVTCPP